MADPIPLSSSLDTVMRSLRGTSRVAVSGVFGRWADAVGENVAEHVRPLKLDGDRLIVGVVNPAWATQVAFLESTIIERLADVAGVHVEELQVRVVDSFVRSRSS